jgi:tRNA (Thr-GGU) A37 N-methylase
MEFSVRTIATVHNSRPDPIDDGWGAVGSEVRLEPDIPAECLDGIEAFSHVEIVYIFHRCWGSAPVLGSERPRENPAWSKVGIFAQRKKSRLNFIGCTVAKLARRCGRSLIVERLDAIDGTPVIDIKPVMREFLPEGDVRQPVWAEGLMRNYWGAQPATEC